MDEVITAQGLTKSFMAKGKRVEAVRGVDFAIRSGEIFGFLGPNGAGKTTTQRMLTTLLPIESGTATVAGYDVAHQPRQVRQHVGYVRAGPIFGTKSEVCGSRGPPSSSPPTTSTKRTPCATAS